MKAPLELMCEVYDRETDGDCDRRAMHVVLVELSNHFALNAKPEGDDAKVACLVFGGKYANIELEQNGRSHLTHGNL